MKRNCGGEQIIFGSRREMRENKIGRKKWRL